MTRVKNESEADLFTDYDEFLSFHNILSMIPAAGRFGKFPRSLLADAELPQKVNRLFKPRERDYLWRFLSGKENVKNVGERSGLARNNLGSNDLIRVDVIKQGFWIEY